MNNFISLLNYTVFGIDYTFSGNFSWLTGVYNVLPNILWSILAIIGGAGTVYSVILGVNLAKADSEEKRKLASSRIKNTIIGISVLLGLILILNIAIPLLLNVGFPKSVIAN